MRWSGDLLLPASRRSSRRRRRMHPEHTHACIAHPFRLLPLEPHRAAVASLVCKRWRELCSAGELLHTFHVTLAAAGSPPLLPRLRSLAAWLVVTGGAHVRSLSISIAMSGLELDGACRAEAQALLGTCAAACPHAADVTVDANFGLLLTSWMAGLRQLCQLRLSSHDVQLMWSLHGWAALCQAAWLLSSPAGAAHPSPAPPQQPTARHHLPQADGAAPAAPGGLQAGVAPLCAPAGHPHRAEPGGRRHLQVACCAGGLAGRGRGACWAPLSVLGTATALLV